MRKLVLITVSSAQIRRVRKSRVLNFQQITMPYLAARVPRGWEVIHIDEEAEEINWDIEADLVLITHMISRDIFARAAYALSWVDHTLRSCPKSSKHMPM